MSEILYARTKYFISDTLLQKARDAGQGRGLELWRKLRISWMGLKDQVLSAKGRRYQEPVRCSSLPELWEKLPEWRKMGEELEGCGMGLPDFMKVHALEKLVPLKTVDDLIGRHELGTFKQKLQWVTKMAEHASGAARAAAFSKGGDGGKVPKMDKDGDVMMNKFTWDYGGSSGGGEAAAGGDDLVWALQQEWNKAAQEEDWERAEATQEAIILAITKGKGKGKAPWGNGGGKGGMWGNGGGKGWER